MANSDPTPIALPPGFLRSTTDAAAGTRYVDGYHVRFQNGRPEKQRGFIKYIAEQTLGVVHGSYAWVTTAGNRLLALGDYIRAYSVLDSLDNITPFEDEGTLGTDPFAVVMGDTTVTVTHVGHGREDGAYVNFSGATAGGGITIDGEYTVTVVDNDHYTIEHSVAAASTDATTGGAAVDYAYEINPGLSDSVIGLGVGVGPVGAGTVGTPRTSGGILRRMRTWFFDNYGNLLLVHPSGGQICLWDEPSADDRAEALSNAPASARASFVTAEGMIVALGTTTPMTLEWSDRDDPNEWTPGETTTANIRTVRTGNELVTGTRFPGDGGQCFWTDTALYGMQFIDSSSFIYETTVLAYDAGLLAPTAYELTRDLILWLTPSLELMLYDGSVKPAPRWDEIAEDFKRRLDADRADKLTFGHNPAKNVIACYYTSIDSVTGENDEFFEVNILDWSYTIGPREEAAKLIKRSAHVHFPTAGGAVVAAGSDRYLYQHEVGLDADGLPMPWRLRTGRLTIMEGAVDSDVNGYIPDCERQVGDITLTVRMFERPNSKTPIDEQVFVFPVDTEIVDMVTGGRYADFEWGCDTLGCDFRFGEPLLDVAAAGRTR